MAGLGQRAMVKCKTIIEGTKSRMFWRTRIGHIIDWLAKGGVYINHQVMSCIADCRIESLELSRTQSNRKIPKSMGWNN